MGEHHDDATPARLSRRDLIRKGAVAGGLAWVAPTILTSPAGALTAADCPQGSCTKYHRIKVGANDGSVSTVDNKLDCSKGYEDKSLNSNGIFCTALNVPAGAQAVAVTCETFNSSHVDTVISTLQPGGFYEIEITLKSGYQFDGAFTKKKSENACTEMPLSNDCRTATFGTNSHIEFAYCGPT